MTAEPIWDVFCPCGEYIVTEGTSRACDRAIDHFLEDHNHCPGRTDTSSRVDFRRFQVLADAVHRAAAVSA